MVLALQIIALVVLLVMAGFFAMAETALLSIGAVTARRLAEEKRRNADVLMKVFEHRSTAVGTILLMTLITQLTATSIAGVIAYKISRGFGTAIATALMTFIIFIYAEVAPKNYAIMHNERVALFAARPIYRLTQLMHPLIRMMIAVANISGRLLGLRGAPQGPFMTEEEILTAMEIGEEQGVIEEEEKRMIHHIFEFGDTVVREIMTPRPDIVSVPVGATTKEAMDVILMAGHSRIPVYRGTLDNVIGILYARDLMSMIVKGETAKSLDGVVRPAIIVPETKRVSELLRELQKQKIHLAVVVDEYGSTVGIATIEDLLEEIVGEIYDEYDLEETRIEQIDANTMRVDGRVSIDDVDEFLGVELSDVDVDTVGGLMLELCGHIPKRGEMATYKNLSFKAEKVVQNRVVSVLIVRLPEREASEAEEKT